MADADEKDPEKPKVEVKRKHRLGAIQVLLESDRGCILTLGAELDDVLEQLLRARFTALFP